MTPPFVIAWIISGGQTGVDRAALDWALTNGIKCGGWCPLGRRAEDGVLAVHYPLRETTSPSYAARTLLNVRDSDATLILNIGSLTGGTALTKQLAINERKPVAHLPLDRRVAGDIIVMRQWLSRHRVAALNVAGPRESKCPGIYRLAYDFMTELVLRHGGA